MSTRTIVRDRIVSQFQAVKAAQSGRVKAFDISLRWLTDTETKRASTYCVVVTDEARAAATLQDDTYTLSGAIVIYAYETADARAKMDLMIEDAIDVLRVALRLLKGTIERAVLDGVTTSEASTAEGDWPQAIVRWSAVHHRPVIL